MTADTSSDTGQPRKRQRSAIIFRLRKIIDFEPYTDGVRIEEDTTGKPLVFSRQEQNLGPLLGRLLNEARQ